MTENTSVKFRWFRTVETTAETVKLLYKSLDWIEVKLSWDNQKLLYESQPSPVPLGKYEAVLVINEENHPCQQFTVVEPTFEVNLFLRNDDILNTNDGSTNFCSNLEQLQLLSPLKIDTTWPSTYLSHDKEYKKESVSNQGIFVDEIPPSSSPSNKIDDLLAIKDVEILNLRSEVRQLHLLVGEMEVALTFLRMNNQSKVWQAHEMIEELNSLQKEKRTIELQARHMESSLQENKDCRESLEWEVNELRRQLDKDDPVEVIQLIMEMKTLREELFNVCRMNKELVEEVLTLREENTRLKSSSTDPSAQQMKSEVTLYYSDPDSGSTQYRQLPIANSSSSKSLPTVLLTERVEIPQRSISMDPVYTSPVSSDSLLTDELLNFATPTKVVSGVQTDITALHGSPVRYRKKNNKIHLRKKQVVKNRQSKSKCKRREITTIKKTPVVSATVPYFKSNILKEERDSSDTEELLQEAEQFLLNVTSSYDGILRTNMRINDGSGLINQRESTNITTDVDSQRKVRESNCPFIPKCALDLQPGYVVRYHGSHGRITQGKVSFIGPLPDKVGTFIGIEDESSSPLASSHPPNRTFIPFKKVILAWGKKCKT